MANTVIRLKKSSISGREPTTLEHGELAINYTDGKLFYRDDANVIQRISGGANSFMYMNVAGTMLVAGVLADVLTINEGDNIQINTDALTNKYTITANLRPAFRVANAAFALANDMYNVSTVVSNTAPSNPVQGKLWWNSILGTLFVYFVDEDGTTSWVEAVPNGGGTSGTGGGGTTDISPAFNVANAAFAKANSANVLAYNTGVGANNYANTLLVTARAYTNTSVSAANDYTNTVLTLASAAFDRANSSNDVLFVAASFDKANAANVLAAAAFNAANNAVTDFSPAFNQANSKTYTFYQTTAPTTSNAHDLWVNSNTGTVYENFGTNTSPIWAEFGPSTAVANLTPGIVSAANLVFNDGTYQTTAGATRTNAAASFNHSNITYTAVNSAFGVINSAFGIANTALQNTTGTLVGDLTVTGNVITNKQVIVTYTPSSAVNTAIEISAANSKGGIGYADFLLAKNISGGATNPNKYFRLGSTGTIEIINSAYTSILASLSDSGNLSTSGTISAGAYSAGQVIKDVMLSNSEVTVVSTTIATSGSVTNFVTYNYTPVSSSSYLIVHYHLSKYQPQGTTDDSWYSQLLVDGSEIAYGWQMVNDNGTGTSGRSGVLFPLTGRYTNSSTSAKQIQVAARRDAADDSIIIDNSATSMWLRITEIAR